MDTGLLILRLGLGLQLILHGYPKFFGGPEKWVKLGKSMSQLHIDFGHTFWGFMAAFAEFGGGILVIIGLFSRPVAVLVSITMLVACIDHWSEDGAKWMDASHAFELFMVFLAYYFTGPGRFSLDRRWFH